jgi:hypothetical protein
MSTIVAAHFQRQDQIDTARQALMDAGFTADHISAFYVNSPGQHDLTAIGGDHVTSPGAKETPEALIAGAAGGAVVGAALGLASAVVTGPVGPVVGGLVGAHVGTLFSFSKMKDAGEHEADADAGERIGNDDERAGDNRGGLRHAGMLVAVALADAGEEARALSVLRGLGAEQIERADGRIANGDWDDFDPNSVPKLIH